MFHIILISLVNGQMCTVYDEPSHNCVQHYIIVYTRIVHTNEFMYEMWKYT